MPAIDAHSLWYLLAGAMIVIGFIGTVLPIMPGVPVVFCGMWLAAWADDYRHVGTATLLTLAVLTLITLAVDIIAGVLGAKRVGASRLAVIGAAVGTVIGIFMGLVGLVIGPFAGALVGELAAGGDLRKATDVGVAAWLGYVIGAVIKIGICFAMLGIFVFAFAFG